MIRKLEGHDVVVFFRGSIKLSGSRESILAATMILANEFLHVLAIFLLCLLKKSYFDPL